MLNRKCFNFVKNKDTAIQESILQGIIGTQVEKDNGMEKIPTLLQGSINYAKETGATGKRYGISIQDQIDIDAHTAIKYTK